MLTRAFDNLINNAVNYTPDGSEINVTVSSDGITITNTGISLSKEMCRKAFEPFVKDDKSRSGQKGNGLGLAIAKQIFDIYGMPCVIESDNDSVSVKVIWK